MDLDPGGRAAPILVAINKFQSRYPSVKIAMNPRAGVLLGREVWA